MAIFNYIALDPSGVEVKGKLDAPDEKTLAAVLRSRGVYLMEVKKAGDGASRGARKLFRRRSKVTAAEVAIFTCQLSSLLEAGVPLDKAVSILSGLAEGAPLRELLEGMSAGIQGGRSFADCLAGHPGVFPEIYVNTVRAGEAGGGLDAALTRMNSYLEESARIKDEVTSALIYPLILAVLGGGAVVFMLVFVVPRFAAVFEDLGGAVPTPAKILMAASHVTSRYFWIAPVISAGIWAFVKKIGGTPEGRLRLDGMKLRAPVIGPLLRKSAIARFARTLGTLLKSGIQILEALALSARAAGNTALEKELGPVMDGVRKGRGVARPIAESGAFPVLAVHMLTVGEETGRLDEMLLKLAGGYEHEVRTSLKRLMAALEPAIIMLMALVVGFIVISLLLAVFSLNEISL
ncbi:Type II secretion system protein F [uncultured bacterium]|nr:Type II secretion system protein F [uncultured bacterium]